MVNAGKLNIAIAHDSLTQLGGAERVLEALHEMYPQAPVFVLAIDQNLKDKYKTWDIRTSWLQIFYNFIPKLQYWLPFIPLAVWSLDFRGFDVVISSSSGFVKNIRVKKPAVHINYCHTPTRFLWSEPKYVDQEAPKLLRPVVKLFLSWMKKWDYKGAQKVNYFIANSLEVQKRIKEYYHRDSKIIYPFIDVGFWQPSERRHSDAELDEAEESQNKHPEILHRTSRYQDDAGEKTYFLLAGRLQAHKKNDLIVEAFNELGLPLHVVGTGRQEEYLKSIAQQNVSFYGKVSDEELRKQYAGALAFIYPQVEDFGIMPLEAAACGTPTLTFAKGGSLETVVAGQTGEFFYSYDKEEIKRAIRSWQPEKYNLETLQSQAKKFSKEQFKQKFVNQIESIY